MGNRMLVVEDEPDGATVVEMMLSSAGIDVAIAPTAEDGLQILAQEPDGFDGVVIDLALPQMDGFELMYAIREDATIAHLPLIAITAFHTPELRGKALDEGFDAYLAKPLDTSIFLGTLERLLG